VGVTCLYHLFREEHARQRAQPLQNSQERAWLVATARGEGASKRRKARNQNRLTRRPGQGHRLCSRSDNKLSRSPLSVPKSPPPLRSSFTEHRLRLVPKAALNS
jgi:hypothetical protein